MFPAMNRYRAALTHFGISALVVGTVFVLVYFLWFPQPLFRGAGGRDLLMVLALVDVTVGPLITLIIFKPGKRGLKFDLAVIAVLQLAALAYGTHVVYEARPVWVVFLKDRFDLVRANQVQEESRAKAPERFREVSLTGPRLAAARIPQDADERFKTMVSALGGVDVSGYPEYYVDYADLKSEVAAKAKPVTELRRLNAGNEAEVDRAIARTGRPAEELRFLPMRAGKNDLTVMLDSRGEVLGYADLKPWQY